jgi:stringent starvation protein B
MAEKSTKPYLIRAIHEWCSDSNLTPYLSVKVDANTRVPLEFVKNGEIVLNVSYDATHRLTIGNDGVQFSARFNGVSRECSVPIEAVLGIFARENGQGLFFEAETPSAAPAASPETTASGDSPNPPPPNRPKLQIVK